MLVCTNCRQGLMDPVRDDEEPEYTDRYQCGHCGHLATIPSWLIIISQIVSAVFGGGVTLYLLIEHGGNAFRLWENGGEGNLPGQLALVLAALTLVAGFIYILLRALAGIALRRRYHHPRRASG